jgi:hypothetical protein
MCNAMKKKDTSSVQVIAAVSAVGDQYELCMAKRTVQTVCTTFWNSLLVAVSFT